MQPPIFLAHGTIGPLDELLPIIVFALFVFMVGLAWFTSRRGAAAEPEDDQPEEQPTGPELNTADHHRLD